MRCATTIIVKPLMRDTLTAIRVPLPPTAGVLRGRSGYRFDRGPLFNRALRVRKRLARLHPTPARLYSPESRRRSHRPPRRTQITFEPSAEVSAVLTCGSPEAGMIVPAVSPPENALHELGHRSRNRPNFMRIVGRSFLQTAVSQTDWGGVDQPNRRIHVSNGAGDDHYSNKSLPRHEDSSGSDSGSTPTRNGLAVNRCPERHHVPSTRHHTARRYRAKTAHDATPSRYRRARIYQQHTNAAGVTTRTTAPTMRPDYDPTGRCHPRTDHLPTKPPGVGFPHVVYGRVSPSEWLPVTFSRQNVGNPCRRALKTDHFMRELAK